MEDFTDKHVDMEEETEEVFDETPDFVDANDAVEVQVDDDIPMDDDDVHSEEDPIAVDEAKEENVVDMSLLAIKTHTEPIYSVACHLEGDVLAVMSGGGDDRAFLHSISRSTQSCKSAQMDFPYKDSVSAVTFNMPFVSGDLTKTPRFGAVGAFDGSIVLFDPDRVAGEDDMTGTGESSKISPVKNLEGPSDVEWMCWHPKGGSVLLVGASGDNTIWMYHTTMNKCLQVFVGHEKAVTAGSFSPDGKWALSASADGTLRVWAPRTGVSKHIFRFGNHNGGGYDQDVAALTCMATGGGSDGQLVIAGAEDGQAHVCHVGTKKVVATLRHFEPPIQQGSTMDEDEQEELQISVEAVGFSPFQPNWCATGGVDGILKIWDLSNGAQCRQSCQPSLDTSERQTVSGGITRLEWHPSLPLIFSATCSGIIHIWDTRNGKLLKTLSGHTDVINDMSIKYLPDNANKAVIVTGSDDACVRIFEVDLSIL